MLNTYLVPIVEDKYPYIKEFRASSLSDCEDRIIDWVYNTWDIDILSAQYHSFCEQLGSLYGIYIGEIKLILK